MLVIGIDDSGRGPVIGPMVLAGVLIPEEIEAEFKKQGIKDSKQLAAKKREFLAEKIKKQALSYYIVQVSPDEIDSRTGNGTNLNKLEAVKSAEIINFLLSEKEAIEQVKKEKIKAILDCPSPNIKTWIEYLKNYVNKKEALEIIGEHKADVNHPSVSAASILAKTTRDAEIEKIKKKIGIDFGSGYSSDPITCKFLQEHSEKYKHDGIFRKTWGTWKDLCKKKEQKKLGEY